MIPEPLFYAALAYAVAFVVGYVWMGLALGALYRKFGARPGRAWVPVLRYAELATLTQSGAAAVIVARVLAPVGAAAAVTGILVGSATGDALALGGLVVALVASVAAWLLWVMHAHRLGLDHALSAGWTVLAALLPAVWAAVLGWGSTAAATATGPIPLVVARREAGEQSVPAPAEDVSTAFEEHDGRDQAPAVVPDTTAPAFDQAPDHAETADAEADPADASVDHDSEGTSMKQPEQEPAAETEPIRTAPTDTVPIAVRRSPYADLAPRDLEPVDPPVRRSRYAELAARERPPAPEPAEPELAEPAPTTPTFLVVPALPPSATEDIPVQESAVTADPSDRDPERVPEATTEPLPLPPTAGGDAAAGAAADPVAPAPAAPAPHVDPAPSGPVSPYMRGGAAAPPAAPSIVPSFELPEPVAAPVPLADAVPEQEPEPVAEAWEAPEAFPAPEPAPAPTPAPEPEPEPAPAPVEPAPAPPASVADAPAATIDAPPADGAPAAWAGGAAFPGMSAGAARRAEAPMARVQEPDAAEDDRTQVSARVRERWELVAADGRAYPLTSAAVLVGRTGGFPPLDGTPRLDLEDGTRTVSKSHARLALDQGRWWVEDLGSTNGTYLIDGLGRETQVEPGAAVPVEGRLAFGDVELELRRRDGA